MKDFDSHKELFQGKGISPNGRYEIRMFDTSKREWVTFVVDDFVPVSTITNLPWFVKSHGSIWGLLLEKVFAKCSGSYSALDARAPREERQECPDATQVMCMLTGSRTVGHFRKTREERNLWRLKNASLPVTAECDPNSEAKGDLAQHALFYEEEIQGKRMRYTCGDDPQEGWISTSNISPAELFLYSAAGWSYSRYTMGPDKDSWKSTGQLF